MRILHVDPERAWGGGEVQVLGLVRHLDATGHTSVLAVHPDGRLAREASARGHSIVPLPIRNDLDVRAGWRLRRLARDVDVVHFHTSRAHALAPWLMGTRVRRVVTRRMDYVPRPGPWTRWLYGPAVDQVIAISQGVRGALVRAGVPEDHVRVVPSGVDMDRVAVEEGTRVLARAAFGVAPEEVAVLGLGALERRKGFDVLIDAAARLGSGRVHVLLAGDGSEGDALERRAAAAGVSLERLGFQAEVGAVLAAADVVAVPSRAEGLGISALEAMAAGRAVVASRVGGLAEVVTDGATGLVVPPEDVAAFAAALGRLVDEPDLRERLAARAVREVATRFSMRAMAAGTLACYGEAP